MGRRKLGLEVNRPGRTPGDPDISIPVAQDLLKVKGVPIRDPEVSYYSREFPLESYSLTESASAAWAEKEREKVSPEISKLYSDYQKKILPWVDRLADISKRSPSLSSDCTDISNAVRAKARELGYGEVGFVRFDKRYIYSSRRSHVRQDLPNAICLAVEQDYVKTQEIPGMTAEEAQGDAYLKQAELSIMLAEYLLQSGYSAQISGPVWHFGPVIPMFVQAGLGQLGVNGQLLSPHFGSRARLQVLITDAPLTYDSPVDYGIYKLCETCQICFMRCPGKAIQAQRVWFRGVEKNKLITRRCRPVMTRFSGCGICIKVCPVQKYGMAPVMEHYLETGEILGKGSDDLEAFELQGKGYYPSGKLPSFDREFFDMPEGTQQDLALDELNTQLSVSEDLTVTQKEEIWSRFQERVEAGASKERRIVDMGMDIDV